jgi:hypothetical protein
MPGGEREKKKERKGLKISWLSDVSPLVKIKDKNTKFARIFKNFFWRRKFTPDTWFRHKLLDSH